MNVLIVDDELLVRTGVQAIIDWESSAYTLAGTARNAEQALEMLPHIVPAVVITDISMPGMNGLEFIAEANQRGLLVEWIILTSHREFDLAKQAVSLGAVEYLLKYDLNAEDLLTALSEATRRFQENQIPLAAKQAETACMQCDDEYLLLMRVEDAAELIRKRGQGNLTSSLTAVAGQISGSNADVILHSQSSGVWVYRMCLHSRSFFGSENVQRAFCRRLSERINSLMNMSVRICLCHETDIEKAVSEFDARFTLESSCVLATDSIEQSAGEQFTKVSMDISRRIELMAFSDLPDLFSGLHETARLEFVNRDRLISTVLSLMQQLQGLCSGNSGNKGGWLRLYDQIQNAAGTETTLGLCLQGLALLRSQCTDPKYPQDIQRVLKFIHEHYQESISLDEASSIAGKSPSYFSTYFMKYMSMHFVDYVNAQRIEAACRELRSGQVSLEELAERCGFSSEKYFLRVFKRTLNCTPRQWKSKNSIP